MNDYEVNLKKVSELPKFYLGQEVVTPNGKGIIKELCMPSNGLYISPERATVIVWYGTDNTNSSMVQEEFYLQELNEYVYRT